MKFSQLRVSGEDEFSQNSVKCEDFKLGLGLALNDIMRILKRKCSCAFYDFAAVWFEM